MWRGDHLRKVDHCDVVFVIQHEVELIEISMDEAVIGQFHDQIHNFTIQGSWIFHFMHLTSGEFT